MAKKKIELKPKAEEIKNVAFDKDTEKEFLGFLKNEYNAQNNEKNDSADSLFRGALENLTNNDKNLPAKTEYMNVKETFQSAKLDVISKVGSIPLLTMFNNSHDLRRISKDRMGRQETIRTLQKREQEEQRELMRKELESRGIEL